MRIFSSVARLSAARAVRSLVCPSTGNGRNNCALCRWKVDKRDVSYVYIPTVYITNRLEEGRNSSWRGQSGLG